MAGGEGLKEALTISDGFRRVQINIHGGLFLSENVESAGAAIQAFIDKSTANTIILQHRSDWNIIVPMIHDRLEYLFDRSEGSGMVDFRSWPDPSAEGRWGYSGGIGPENIGVAMRFAGRHKDARLWFDMESQVRTDGWLDLGKVLTVCDAAFSKYNG